MNEAEKILELLEKIELSSDEKKELDKLLKGLPGSEKIVQIYNELKNSFLKDSHIDEGLLGEYVLYKNNMLDDKRTMHLLERKIEDHLRSCKRCAGVFKELNSEYTDIDSFITGSVRSTGIDNNVKSVPAGFFRKFTSGRFAFASIATIIIIYLGMFAASAVFTPDYKKFAISTEERDFYNTRGRTSELFQRGLNAVDKKDYGNAVRFFEEDIRNNENEASIFYSHFILGMTYIQSSESSLLGTFKFFDEEKVEEGIKNLQKAINLNHSGRYENLNLDAHYFIGKAYMLIDKNNLAVDHLKTVVNNKGSYYKKAEKLLEEVSKR